MMTMPSAQYLTLEEFLSSPSPLPTILLPRPHALRLVQLYELAEMTPPSHFLNFLFQNENDQVTENNSPCGNDNGGVASVAGEPLSKSSSSSSSFPSNSTYYNVNHNPHVLVTQMALLLYLGEYTHAHHLWRRSQKNYGGEDANRIHNNDDFVQLEQLWNAAKYMQLWNTGGMQTIDSVVAPASSSSSYCIHPSNTATNASQDTTGMASSSMQIENKDDAFLSLEDQKYDVVDGAAKSSSSSSFQTNSTVPFSTLALRALHSCHTSKMEPLSTYAAELKRVFRYRINQRLHKYVAKLDIAEFRLRMNFSDCGTGSCCGEEEEEEDWIAYGWKKEKGGNYLVSEDIDGGAVFDGDCDVDVDVHAVSTDMDGIEKLTNIVMFLEEKLNA